MDEIFGALESRIHTLVSEHGRLKNENRSLRTEIDQRGDEALPDKEMIVSRLTALIEQIDSELTKTADASQ
jgi:hypothetical protein